MELKRMLNTPLAVPQDEASTNKIPACRVCNGPGNGLHYGVNTCDACKGFFHRTIKLHLQYTCKRDLTCRVQYGRGKMCQHCRYQKCISVGMSRQAVKTGRYTLTRKADCILKMKKREMSVSSSKPTLSTDDQSASNADVPWIEDSFRCMASLDDSSIAQSPSELAASATPIDCENSPYSTASISSDSDTTSSSDSNVIVQRVLHDILHTYPDVISFSNSTAMTSIHSNIGIEKDGDNCNKKSSSSMPIEIKEDSRTLEMGASPENSSTSSTMNKDSYKDPPSASLSIEESFNDPISNLYMHKNDVIQSLLKARMTTNASYKYTQHELTRQSVEFYEYCRRKEEMFGRLQILSEEEYDRVMELTGIDADGRQSFFSQFLDGLESLVRSMVQFMKVIPGFLSLDLVDQISLVKQNRMTFRLIQNYAFSNTELGIIHCENNKWVSLQDALSPELYYSAKEYLDVQRELQHLDLHEEEQAVLCAVTAMNPGCHEETNKIPIHEIYQNLTDVLIYCLGKRHKNPHKIFGNIMQILTRSKPMEGTFRAVLTDLNILKYSELNKRPLLKEISSDFDSSTSGM